MTLNRACEIGRECGLHTLGEAYYNVRLHGISIFNYNELEAELKELEAAFAKVDEEKTIEQYQMEVNNIGQYRDLKGRNESEHPC